MKNVMVALGLAALCTSSCASRTIVRVDKPFVTKGVTVSLVAHACRLRPTYQHDAPAFLDLDLTLQIRNTGFENASFDAGALRLLAGGTWLMPVDRPFTETIRPGSRQWLEVHFVGSDALRCSEPMTLAFGRVLQIDPAPVRLGSIASIGTPTLGGWSP